MKSNCIRSADIVSFLKTTHKLRGVINTNPENDSSPLRHPVDSPSTAPETSMIEAHSVPGSNHATWQVTRVLVLGRSLVLHTRQ